MRTLLTVASFLLCTGCGPAPSAAAPGAPAAPPDLAAPVLAPMAAREQLLDDLEQQKQKARDRSQVFDDVAGRDH